MCLFWNAFVTASSLTMTPHSLMFKIAVVHKWQHVYRLCTYCLKPLFSKQIHEMILMRWNGTVHWTSSSRSPQSLSVAVHFVSAARLSDSNSNQSHYSPAHHCDVNEETDQSGAERAFPVGILRVSARNSVWGRGESEDKHPNTSHRLDFFLIQVCAANHAQDTGTEAVDFLSNWGLREERSDRISTWLFFSDGIVYVDIWTEQVHFRRASPVMRNDRTGPLTRAWITWFITDHRIPRGTDRTLFCGRKLIKTVWLITAKSTFPPKTSCSLNWIFFARLKYLSIHWPSPLSSAQHGYIHIILESDHFSDWSNGFVTMCVNW